MARVTWHDQHIGDYTAGQRVADSTARLLGSWPFIIGQSVFVIAWIGLNLVAWGLEIPGIRIPSSC